MEHTLTTKLSALIPDTLHMRLVTLCSIPLTARCPRHKFKRVNAVQFLARRHKSSLVVASCGHTMERTQWRRFAVK